MNDKHPSKILKGSLFVLFLLTVLFTLLSGVGTYCAAFDTELYPSMAALLPYQLLYQVLFFISIIIGLIGVWVTISFIRGKGNIFRNVIIVLVIGLAAATTQMIASEIIRGNSIPVNIRAYFTLFTLLLFLIVRYTPLWQRSGLLQVGNSKRVSTTVLGVSLFVGGVIILTTWFWVGNSHFAENGYNWVYDLRLSLNIAGSMLIVSGTAILAFAVKIKIIKTENTGIVLEDHEYISSK